MDTSSYCWANTRSGIGSQSIHQIHLDPIGHLRYEDASPELQLEARLQLTLAGLDISGHAVYFRPIPFNYLEYTSQDTRYYLATEMVATLIPDP